MVAHQERILVVKDAIKPGYLNIFFKRFTKEMLTNYLSMVRTKQIDVDQKNKKKLAFK